MVHFGGVFQFMHFDKPSFFGYLYQIFTVYFCFSKLIALNVQGSLEIFQRIRFELLEFFKKFSLFWRSEKKRV